MKTREEIRNSIQEAEEFFDNERYYSGPSSQTVMSMKWRYTSMLENAKTLEKLLNERERELQFLNQKYSSACETLRQNQLID